MHYCVGNVPKRRYAPKRTLLAFVLSLMVVGLSSLSVHASTRQCGLYGMYACMQYYDNRTSFETLAYGDYISKPKGSTLTDLSRIAKDFGLYAVPVKNLSLNALRYSKMPLVISVRQDALDKGVGHYYTVLPASSGESILFDASTGIVFNDFNILQGRWNGIALVVSNRPVALYRIFKRHYLYVSLFLLSLFVIRRFIGIMRKQIGIEVNRRYLVHLGIFFMIFFIAAVSPWFLYAVDSQSPLLQNKKVVAAVQARHLEAFLPEIAVSDIENRAQQGHVFIDARLPVDYAQGHLSNAINIPPSMENLTLTAILQAYPKNQPFVVYCQSAGCPYAIAVARRLFENDYFNIFYYKEGWYGWLKYKKGAYE